MFVYLDESGDTGFKLDRGSSRYFVVTLLLVEDPIPIQTAIEDLREHLRFTRGNEFKFYRSRESVRTAFLDMLRRQSFMARALVVDKQTVGGPPMQERESFYASLVRLLLQQDEGTIKDALIVLDESFKDKRSKQHLATYVRRALNTDPQAPRIRGVRYHSSRSDNLIQATDMLSGAIYARYHRGDDTYFRRIRVKVGSVWEWRPTEAQ